MLLAVTVIALGAPDAASADHRHATRHASPRHDAAKHEPASSKRVAKTERGGHRGHAAADKDARRQEKRRRGDSKDAHAVPVPPQRPAGAAPDAGSASATAGPAAATATPAVTLTPDLSATQQAISLIHRHRFSEASAVAKGISDPVAQKLVEWALLRNPDSDAGVSRYTAFIRANSDWPGIALMRRIIEEKLWQERQDRRDAATLLRLNGEPTTVAGRLALAHAELREGNRAGAESRVRAVWRSAQLSPELETVILASFPGALTRADHVARMDRRIGAKDFGAAMRAAKHVGDDHVAIVKACSSAEGKAAKAGALLDQVPSGARSDLGYTLCRMHWLMRNDSPGSNVGGHAVTPKGDIDAAAKLALSGSPEDMERQDTDEWWRERRLLARKLLDLGDAQTAYRVVRAAAMPSNPYYRADLHFMPGWIALRFLNDPVTAAQHFARVDEGSSDPIVLSRAAYWRGRAAEAAGHVREMRTQYLQAARFSTAYYGQLARARLGLDEIATLRPSPERASEISADLVHAANILYKIGEKSLVRSFVTDLADESGSAATLAALGQLTAQHDDAQSMLLMGRRALARGLALDQYAFPAIGVPVSYNTAGAKLDQCNVYSIVRTESSFDQRDRSQAKAVGLMQVTPTAGRDTARRFHMTYDWNRLVSDPVYNTQMGAAEIAALLDDYRGSYIMTFAGYNAGRGRVSQWVAQHGDPRDPKVDAVDWVERIPFSETRNYVQRVMENLQVYRIRFGATMATVEPNLHRAANLD
jgi:soluble lytic murein transglycosylase